MSRSPQSKHQTERQTRQKSAVFEAIKSSGRSLNPAEICQLAKQQVPTLNLSTVYRQIKSLQDEAKIWRVDLPGHSPRFEVACDHAHDAHPAEHPHHHHHFHCEVCGRVYPIHACPGSLQDLAPEGFVVAGHALTLRGQCASCRGASQPQGGQA